MPDIKQEKAEEYRQVAALLASSIETFEIILEDETMTVEEIRNQADRLVKDMREITTDKESRENRWGGMCAIWGGVHGAVPDNG